MEGARLMDESREPSVNQPIARIPPLGDPSNDPSNDPTNDPTNDDAL
jgi:hypothetical protein